MQARASAHELQEPSSATYTAESRGALVARLDKLEASVRASLKEQGFEGERVAVERALNMRFDGTDTALMVVPEPDEHEDFAAAFLRAYKHEFGFLLAEKGIVVDDLKVRGTGRTFDSLGPSVFAELRTLETRAVDEAKAASRAQTYFDGAGRVDTPVFQLDSLATGEVLRGPAVVIDDTQTIVLVPGANATVASRHLVIRLGEE
jgi:5-oxoprolinase (ATP-hydrolysing)